jgi:hypothetical protein
MSEEIAESLREISTPTGLSYSGDRTLNNSYTEKIIDYINSLQQKVEQLENIRKEAIKLIEEDILGKKIENVNWDYDDCYYSDMPVERIKPLLNILNKGDNNGK